MKPQRWIGFLLVLAVSLYITSPAAALPPMGPRLPVMAPEAASATADGMWVEPAGWVGSGAMAVAVQGSYAYVSGGPGLVILDISNPTQPIVVGQSAGLPYMVRGLAVSGDYVYLAAGGSGLRIINAANRAAPVEVGFHNEAGGGYATAVAVAGTYAYVADGNGVRIIQVSNAAGPAKVGFYDAPYFALDVALAGGYAYVTDYRFGLRIVNVTNPAAPVEVGFYDQLAEGAGNVAVVGNYAYVTDNSGLTMLNIANAAAPVKVGFYDTPGYPYDVAVGGNYAYVAEQDLPVESTRTLRVINVANPAAPVQAGYRVIPDSGEMYYGSDVVKLLPKPHTIALAGSYAYVAADVGGLRIMNVANPAAPAEAAVYSWPDRGSRAVLAGNYAYVARGYDGGLHVINIANPAAPTRVGFCTTPGPAQDVALARSYAYVAGGSSGLRIIDVANSAAPTEVGFYDTAGYAQGVAVRGSYAYVADASGGLRIIDVANPAAPTDVGSCDTPGSAQDVALAGHYAYVADGDGLRIIDVANPAAPAEVGFCDTPGSAAGVALLGNYAYVSGAYGEANGLRIVNVANPAAPVEVGFYSTGGYDARSVAVAGNLAWVPETYWHPGYNGKLLVVDVANPGAPVLVASYSTPGNPYDVVLADSYAYMVGQNPTLLTLRLWRDKVTSSVSTSGGTLTSTSGDSSLICPSGAFTGTVTLTYRHYWADQKTGALAGIRRTFDLSAVYAGTGQAASLAPGQTFSATLHYGDGELSAAIESTLALYAWVGGQWAREPSSVVDTSANTVTATPGHLGLFAVLGETLRVFLPVIMR